MPRKLRINTNRYVKLRCNRLEDRMAPASFQGIGDLPGGDFGSFAMGISPDGLVVVGGAQSEFTQESFRWTANIGMISLNQLPSGNGNSALGVSADGSVIIGNWGVLPQTVAFRWTANDGMVSLGDLPGGQFQSLALGVSANGSVIVGSSQTAAGAEAFRWTSAGMVSLGYLTGGRFGIAANGVSQDGSVVVGSSVLAGDYEAFRWTAGGTAIGLGDLLGGGFFSSASAVSADGSVVVGVSESATGYEIFRWTTNDDMLGLGYLPGGEFNSSASAVCDDGSVVVGESGYEAFIWTTFKGMRNLHDVLVNDYKLGSQMSTWQLRSARACSADGKTIVGWGINPASELEGWIARLDLPDPDDQVSEAHDLGTINTTKNWVDGVTEPTDVDMFKFTVAAQQRVAFDIDNKFGNLSSYLRLFDNKGVPITLGSLDENGHALREPANDEWYIEHTFTQAGDYYVGVSGKGNETYNAVTGNGDTPGSIGNYELLVTPLTQVTSALNVNRITGRINMPNHDQGLNQHLPAIDVSLQRIGNAGIAADNILPGVPTWILVHGRVSDPMMYLAADADPGIAGYVDRFEANDQVLVLDWRQGAFDNHPPKIGLDGGAWINYVGDWAAGVCRLLGISGAQLRVVGHSWGTFVTYEIGRRDSLKALVALDPALEALEYADSKVHFGSVSQRSWSIYGDGVFGSATRSLTAHESFRLRYAESVNFAGPFDRHWAPVYVFHEFMRQNITGKAKKKYADLFSLTHLLMPPTTRPWRENHVLYSGFDGEFLVGNGGPTGRWDQIISFQYFDRTTGRLVTLQ